MTITRNITAIILMVGMITILPKKTFAQESSTYKMKFVRACQDSSDKGNYIMAVFSVLPTIKDFKLMMDKIIGKINVFIIGRTNHQSTFICGLIIQRLYNHLLDRGNG